MHRCATNPIWVKLALGISLASIALPVRGAETSAPTGDPVFQKLLDSNKGLASYKAHITVQTRLPLGNFTLHGTVYSRGERSKVVFDNIPAIAKRVVDNQPSIGPAASWSKQYMVSVASRTPDVSTYHLVPIVPGSTGSIDVSVQNTSGLVQHYFWTNTNGTMISSDQTYETIGGYQLVKSTSTKTRGGGVRADSESTFADYALNVSVPDAVFAAKR
jgi:hypothetical protein